MFPEPSCVALVADATLFTVTDDVDVVPPFVVDSVTVFVPDPLNDAAVRAPSGTICVFAQAMKSDSDFFAHE